MILFFSEEKMDFPSGPLDIYRSKASFSWKEMLNFLEEEDIQAFKVREFIVQLLPWQH